MRRLVLAVRPHLWASVHSGMRALFMPFDHRAGGLDRQTEAAMRALLGRVNRRHCSSNCTLGGGGGSVG